MGLADVYVDQALVRSHIQVAVSCNNLFYRASRWVCVFLSPEAQHKLAERAYASDVLAETCAHIFFPGWNAWYNWSIVLPAELSASSIIASFYVPAMADTERYNSIVKKLSYGTTSVLVRVCQDNQKTTSVTIFAARVCGGHQLPGQVRSI